MGAPAQLCKRGEDKLTLMTGSGCESVKKKMTEM